MQQSLDINSQSRLVSMQSVQTFNIALPMDWGFVDLLEVDPCGILRIVGWSRQESTASLPPPDLFLDRSWVELRHVYRTTRPDVPTESNDFVQAGFAFEYLLREEQYASAFTEVSVRFSNRQQAVFHGDFQFVSPHYGNLLVTQNVFHREHIYGSGPPNPGVSAEVLPLLGLLKGQILDFGCGSGAAVAELRSRGLDARGLELHSDIIRNAIDPSIRPFISLYDGHLPSPFASKSFDSVYSSEVLEHIPNYEEALAEMARLARNRLILTTPDISVIAIGFRSSAVPWHLLEGSHVNFFTQASLKRLLERHFSHIEFGRISANHFNGSSYHVSLVASCSL
jgi:2-polyprenyl-3-methyl-5-hydroxy-6-metoxy-1,4-benzoquinol methylase